MMTTIPTMMTTIEIVMIGASSLSALGALASFGVLVFIALTYKSDGKTRKAQLYYQTIEQVNKVEDELEKLFRNQEEHVQLCQDNYGNTNEWDSKIDIWDAYLKFVKYAQDKIRGLAESKKPYFNLKEYKIIQQVWRDTHPVVVQLENLSIQLEIKVLDEDIVFKRIGSMLGPAYLRLEPGEIVRDGRIRHKREDEIYYKASVQMLEKLKERLNQWAEKQATP